MSCPQPRDPHPQPLLRREIAGPRAGAACASPARASVEGSDPGTAAGRSACPRAARRRGRGRAARAARARRTEAAAAAAAAAAAPPEPPWLRRAPGVQDVGSRRRGGCGGCGVPVADVTRVRQPGKWWGEGAEDAENGRGRGAAAPRGCGRAGGPRPPSSGLWGTTGERISAGARDQRGTNGVMRQRSLFASASGRASRRRLRLSRPKQATESGLRGA